MLPFLVVLWSFVVLMNTVDAASKVSFDVLEKNIMANAPLIYKNGSTEYFPYFGVSMKLLFADPASGAWGNQLYGRPGEELGIHRHHGFVYGYTLSGKWGYREHANEWMAEPGDLIFEEPGSVHTLFIAEDSPEDAVVFFIVYGSLEYLDEYGDTIVIEDWRTVSQRYYDYCKANNIEPYDLTHPRQKAKDLVFKSKSNNNKECKP